MNNRISGGLLALLFVCPILLPGAPTIEATENKWEVVAFSPITNHNGIISTINTNHNIEMWHYSGGYWGGNIVKIPDTTVFDNADNLAKELNQAVTFETILPSEVKDELQRGNRILISCEPANIDMKAESMYYLDGSKGHPEFSMVGDTLYFKAYPKLNFREAPIYDDYVLGLKKSIPIVHPAYGKNRYSIFTKGGRHLGAADGFIDTLDSDKLGPEGTIHPSQILNSNGNLRPGFRVYIDKEDGSFEWRNSSDVNIGHGTFQDAGAVAMRFEYPMKITFYRAGIESKINMQFWDTLKNEIFHRETIRPGEITNGNSIDINVDIPDFEGYGYRKSYVLLPDESVQYDGNDRSVSINLSAGEPEKYLNVEYLPCIDTDISIRYWDKTANQVLHEETQSNKVFADEEYTSSIEIPDLTGYIYDGWNIQFPDGTIDESGNDRKVDITLNGDRPSKILNIEYTPKDGTTPKPSPTPTPTVTQPPSPTPTITPTPTATPIITPEPTLPPPEPPIIPSGNCDGDIIWSEIDSHTIRLSTGRSRTCNHTFTYKSTLTANAAANPSSLKSGYGFDLSVDCAINPSQLISNLGNYCNDWNNGRSPVSAVRNPTKATVHLPWFVTNSLGTQGYEVLLENFEPLKFRPHINPISVLGNRTIFTNVAIAGTSENPHTHSFSIYITGGGVGSIEFCKTIDASITITGDMYEDNGTTS